MGPHVRAAIYLRVSTIDQTTANQERELRRREARDSASRLQYHLALVTYRVWGGVKRQKPVSPSAANKNAFATARKESIVRGVI